MNILIVIPLQRELDFLVHGIETQGFRIEKTAIGRVSALRVTSLGLVLVPGGLGKTQFGVQTQYLIDAGPDWDAMNCTGAAGGLSDSLAVGDVVIGSETIEFDIKNRFGPPSLPRFRNADWLVDELVRCSNGRHPFRVQAGAIASGDEDVIDVERRRQLREQTGAMATAWEGAGGARACHFSAMPFVEVRGISDSADETAAQDFTKNLPVVMQNIAGVVTAWAASRTQL